jgi:hypothetical protein
MKYRLLLLSSLLVSGAAFAQHANPNMKKADIGMLELHAEKTVATSVHTPENKSNYTDRVMSDGLGEVIESLDFSAGYVTSNGTWTNSSLANGNEEWEYRGPSTTPDINTGSRGQWAGSGANFSMQSTSRLNGYAIMDSDWWDGGTNGTSGQQSAANHQAALTSPILDLSTYPAALLTFESYLRNFQSFFYVIVTTDGFSTSDTVWNGEDTYTVNEDSPNAELIKINVTDEIGGASAAQIRFLYSSNGEATNPGLYYWMIDDIVLATPPDHDLAIDDVFYNGVGPFVSDYQFNNYYQQIPVRQSSADEVVFGAATANRGTTAQTNANLTVDVAGPASFNSSNTSFTYAGLSFDSTNVVDLYSADEVGSYDVTFTVGADSTDDFPEDNVVEQSFAVSERIYSRNDDVISSGVFWGTGTYGIYSRFDVFADDTISGVSMNHYYSNTNTNFQTAAGSVAEVGIYAITGYDANGVAVVDLASPMTDANGNVAVAYYVVEEGDQNNTIMVRFDEPVGIPAGVTEFLAGYKVSSGTIRTSTSAEFAGYGNIWVSTDAQTIVGYTSTTNPMINVEMWSSSLCANTTIVISIDADCDAGNYEATLSPNVTSTGSNDFVFDWSTGESDVDEIIVDAEGAYSITVTDANFCTETYDFNIANADISCNLAVGDLANNDFGMKVTPNPNNGQFNIVFDATRNQNANVYVRSLKGDLIYSTAVAVTDGTSIDMNLSEIPSGVYLVKVVGETSTSVERIVVQ